LVYVPLAIVAQPEEAQYNPNSLDPIAKYEQHYKVRVWRELDLREKQNKGFFANNGQITKLITEAAIAGEIAEVYQSDSLKSKYTKEQFVGRMVFQEAAPPPPAWDPASSYLTGDPVSFNGKNYESDIDNNIGINPGNAPNGEWRVSNAGKAITFLPNQIYRINLCEDIIFDKRRSRLYYDIQALELLVFDENKGLFTSLGWFKYKDLEKLFRNNPEKAVWFNRQNTAQNKNFADAFLLRFFKGVIYKLENPDDSSLSEIYNANGRPYYEGVWAREWEEMKLMEKEHNLWEF
jgi:gliding motility associated protien GldN